MYQALAEDKVDAVFGYSTDGEIAAFDLVALEDDRRYFPPYHVAPLVRRSALSEHPSLRPALGKLSGILDDATMATLNARVDQDRVPAARVARDFLGQRGVSLGPERRAKDADVVIGSKIFAEQYILAEMFAAVIETYTDLSVRLNTGLGGTKICFAALQNGDVDVYPEYTGTGLLAILETPTAVAEPLLGSDAKVFAFVEREFRERFELIWLPPLGFYNSYALIVSRADAAKWDVTTVSDFVQRAGR
jgi:osmoprotectant transport system permease protein